MPGTLEYGTALNAIGDLDYLNAITIVTDTPRWGDANRMAGQLKGTTIVETTGPISSRHTALRRYIQPASVTWYRTLLARRLCAQVLAIHEKVWTEEENAGHRAREDPLRQWPRRPGSSRLSVWVEIKAGSDRMGSTRSTNGSRDDSL